MKKRQHIQKLSNLITIQREYLALQNFRNISFAEELLDPYRIHSKKDYFEMNSSVWQKIKSLYNESQIEAIKQSLKTGGITLIQGPPGTGKTTTVIATVSVLLNSYQSQKEEPVLAEAAEGKQSSRPRASKPRRPRSENRG